MATKLLAPDDIKTSTSYLNQLVDVIQEDISGSSTRRTYDVFVTSSIAGVSTYSLTSSLFETVYDQDWTLATANPVLDMTVGIFSGSGTVSGSSFIGQDADGKLLFTSQSAMMREKVAIYQEYAQVLLGDRDLQFTSPFTVTTSDSTAAIDEALFINFKRLFSRDKIKPETFAMKFSVTGALDGASAANSSAVEASIYNAFTGTNINRPSQSGSTIFSDVGAASSIQVSYGGQVGNVVNASDTSRNVGLMFYDAGIGVFDLKKIVFANQHMSGTISAMGPGSVSLMGDDDANAKAKFIPDFMVSGSINDIVTHIATTRFGTGSDTGITFQNITNINSTLVFCRATADEFNFSTNPTSTDENGRLVVIDPGQEDTQRTFSFITSVGLYDTAGDLLAVAKLNRPIEKNDEKDLTIRVRLDF